MGLGAISKYFKIFDLYGEPVGFTFEDGNAKFKSVIGAVLSIVVLAAVASQSVEKFDVLVSRGDTNYQEFSYKREEQKVLNWRNTNFNIAFGITANKSKKTQATDDVFKPIAQLMTMTDRNSQISRQDLPLKICDQSDVKNFNRNGDDGKAEQLLEDISSYQLYCLEDLDSWEITRTNFVYSGVWIEIRIERCNGPDCELTDEEWEQINEKNAFRYIMNTDEYLPTEYGTDIIRPRLFMSNNLNLRENQLWLNLKENRLSAKDSLLSLSSTEKTFYTVSAEEGSILKSPKSRSFHVKIYLDGQILNHERSVYTVLDMLGDIGGLFDALNGICTVLLFFLSFIIQIGPNQFLIGQIFKKQLKVSDEASSGILSKFQARKHIKQSYCKCLTLFNSKQKRLQERAEQALSKQFDVVHFIKEQMITRSLRKILYSRPERKLLRQHRSFVISSRKSEPKASDSSDMSLDFDTMQHQYSPFFKLFLSKGVSKRNNQKETLDSQLQLHQQTSIRLNSLSIDNNSLQIEEEEVPKRSQRMHRQRQLHLNKPQSSRQANKFDSYDNP